MKRFNFLWIFLAVLVTVSPIYALVWNPDFHKVPEIRDAVLALQVASGMNPDGVYTVEDVDGDGKIGLADAIYICQTIAQLRNAAMNFIGLSLAAAKNNDAVFLAWYPASENGTPSENMIYDVYYSLEENFEPSESNRYQKLTGITETTVTSLQPDTKYYFLVTAADGHGNIHNPGVYKSATTAAVPIEIKSTVTLTNTETENIPTLARNDDTGIYEFQTDDANLVKAGDYLIGKDQEGSGFLRRADSVSIQNGGMVVQTSEASLDEVITPLKLDTTFTMVDLQENSGAARRSSNPQVLEMRSSNGSMVTRQTTYVNTGVQDLEAFRSSRAAVRSGTVSNLDSTGKLQISAQTNRQIRPPYYFALPVYAYRVDENGQIDPQQELGGVQISFLGMTNSDNPDVEGVNYGAYFNKDENSLGWLVNEKHVSKLPYKALFEARTFSGLMVKLEVAIYVLPKGQYNTTFGVNQEFGVHAGLKFEPDLTTSIDFSFGKIIYGEITANGKISADIEAFYNLKAHASIESPPFLLKKLVFNLKYFIGGVPVDQQVILSIYAKLSASASADISAEAICNLSSHLSFGLRYNLDTHKWDWVSMFNFNKNLTFNLGVEGSAQAELRLIPQLDIRFYRVATASFSIEPYLKGTIAAEYTMDADILKQILISQYHMTDMTARLAVEGFFWANLKVWRKELWKMDKTRLFGGDGSKFDFLLFTLPTLYLTSKKDSEPSSPLQLTARVIPGVNNNFKPESASWNSYPKGRFTPDPNNPYPMIFYENYKADFKTNKAGKYKIYFSGNSSAGAISRQYAMTEVTIAADQLQGVPKLTEIIPGDTEAQLVWEAPHAEPGTVFNIYMSSVPGVTPKNYSTLADGVKFANAESPFLLSNLDKKKIYYVVMTGTDSTGESDPSIEMAFSPSGVITPQNVKASAGDGKITITWTETPNYLFNVYAAAQPGVSKDNYQTLSEGKKFAGVSSPFVLDSLTNDKTYYAVVTAVNSSGEESAESFEVNAVPSAAPPGETTNPLGMTFKLIPAGTFMMGSPEDEPGRWDDEGPQHQVTLDSFYMQTTEVTQKQWRDVMGNNPSYFQNCGDDCPVESVSWDDIRGPGGFLEKMNQRGEGTYRLPTEAEWEYAARAGTTTPFYTGACLSTDQANYDGDYPQTGCPSGIYRGKTISVGSFAPNAWGLYDMSGNVYEWVEDDWHSDYTNAPINGTAWIENPRGSNRVLRGGSWRSSARNCRSAYRNRLNPSGGLNFIGFRLARSLGQQ